MGKIINLARMFCACVRTRKRRKQARPVAICARFQTAYTNLSASNIKPKEASTADELVANVVCVMDVMWRVDILLLADSVPLGLPFNICLDGIVRVCVCLSSSDSIIFNIQLITDATFHQRRISKNSY